MAMNTLLGLVTAMMLAGDALESTKAPASLWQEEFANFEKAQESLLPGAPPGGA